MMRKPVALAALTAAVFAASVFGQSQPATPAAPAEPAAKSKRTAQAQPAQSKEKARKPARVRKEYSPGKPRGK
jgi:hypothetical protein